MNYLCEKFFYKKLQTKINFYNVCVKPPPSILFWQFMFVKVFQNYFHLLPKITKISLLCTHIPPYI